MFISVESRTTIYSIFMAIVSSSCGIEKMKETSPQTETEAVDQEDMALTSLDCQNLQRTRWSSNNGQVVGISSLTFSRASYSYNGCSGVVQVFSLRDNMPLEIRYDIKEVRKLSSIRNILTLYPDPDRKLCWDHANCNITGIYSPNNWFVIERPTAEARFLKN